ncbi:hypothetical protein MTR67_039038 [Solanum verrucosum]|uniref:Uncharacterized protein n=1 Tax=Solanum verrucosum TaxID=315347 RepID=A0AAF0UG79_SOLVR|nr:hypothetical protein MTR67_039038 [Solanum verrucosum]
MAKMITQLFLLSKQVMGCGLKDVNVVGKNVGQCPYYAKFEALHNKEVQYLGNQIGGSHPYYKRQDGNQGWNKDHNNGWRDRGAKLER